MIANTPSSQVAALALLQTAVIFVPVAAFGAVVVRGSPGERRRICRYRLTKRSAPTRRSTESRSRCSGHGVVLVGPSGCGKTTLLRLIAGLDVPDAARSGWPAGSAAGRIRPTAPASRVRLSGSGALAALDGSENLDFVLASADATPARRRGHDVLALVRIEDLAGRYPHELSGGEQQRVALARARSAAPLLLMDEPFSSLDAELRGALRRLARLQRALGLRRCSSPTMGKTPPRWPTRSSRCGPVGFWQSIAITLEDANPA